MRQDFPFSALNKIIASLLVFTPLLFSVSVHAQFDLPRTGDGFFTDRAATDKEKAKEAREQESRASRDQQVQLQLLMYIVSTTYYVLHRQRN